ncbi:MAG: hypothetical protein V3S55_09945 [Nitrospiraceae bacterium]
MEILQHNADALLLFPLIEDGDADFVTDYTPAAGDAKVWTDKLISTNPTALILGFDSLSELPNAGDQLDENGAGTAEGVVAFTVIVSGTVGGGDAAGFFFMRSVTGEAWSNNDQIDINGGTANIATADSTTYDLAATAGLIASLGNGQFAAALSPTEMSCSQGHLTIVDSATKVIEDQAIHFRTAGDASAYYAYDPFDSVRLGLTALPNAAADAAGGLIISDAGGFDTDALVTDIADIPTVAEFNARTLPSASYFDPAADTVALVTTVTTLTGHTAQTADHTAGIADIPTVAEFNARTLVSASYFDPAADAVADVTTVATLTGHTVQTGDSFPITTALGATAAATLALSMAGTITGAAVTGTLSTTQATTDLTGFTDDQLIGRVIVWTSGAADGEATDITDSAAASGLLTFTAVTLAPANGNTFIII